MRDSQQSSQSSANAPVVDPQTRCHLFRLPRELRDLVYDYTFAEIHRDPIPVSNDPLPTPKLDLALTCRRICHEALQPYRVGWTGFFSDNTFAIPDANAQKIPRVIERHTGDINHFTIDLSNLEPQLVLDLTTKPQSELWHLTWSTGSSTVTQGLSFSIKRGVKVVMDEPHEFVLSGLNVTKDAHLKYKYLAVILLHINMRQWQASEARLITG